MKRREFITLLGGAAVVWPLAARAQQGERERRIAFLHALAEHDPEVHARIAAFRQALEMLGWTENRNVQIEHRFSAGDFARMQTYTTELVNSAPDLIVASGTPVIAALKQATRSIPIVLSASSDLWPPAVRQRGRADHLWARQHRYCPAFSFVCRSHPQGGEAGRPAGAGAGEV